MPKMNSLLKFPHFQERERLFLTRVLVIDLVHALKFKSNIPDSNFFLLVNFILEVCIFFYFIVVRMLVTRVQPVA